MTGWKTPPPILRRVVWRYGLALGSVGVALATALLLGRGFDVRGALFLTAVVLTAWFGGIVPGVTALLLSLLSLGYLFPPLVPYVELAGIRVPYRALSLTAFASLALIVCWATKGRGGAAPERTTLAKPYRSAAAVGLGRPPGWRMRLFQRTVDKLYRRRGERLTRLALDGRTSSG